MELRELGVRIRELVIAQAYTVQALDVFGPFSNSPDKASIGRLVWSCEHCASSCQVTVRFLANLVVLLDIFRYTRAYRTVTLEMVVHVKLHSALVPGFEAVGWARQITYGNWLVFLDFRESMQRVSRVS